MAPKNDYLVFISHSRKDRIITDFIYHLLKAKGAKNEEFFYTSRDDSADQYDDLDSLADQIKKNILKNNVLLLYLTSNEYKISEFCMFECGAGWATRSVGDYICLSLTYPEIPKFITNGKLEFSFEIEKDIPLNRQTYIFIVKMLNRIIEHLNAGRRANGIEEILMFDVIDLPSDIELSRKNEELSDYFDKDIKEYWAFYITKNVEAYMETRYPKSEEQ